MNLPLSVKIVVVDIVRINVNHVGLMSNDSGQYTLALVQT